MRADDFVKRIVDLLDDDEQLRAQIYVKDTKDIIINIDKKHIVIERWFLRGGEDWDYDDKHYYHDEEDDRYKYHESNEIDTKKTISRLFKGRIY